MDIITDIELVIIFAATLLVGILSAIAGGGGGLIMTPLLIFLGLSPAQSVATGKISGLSLSLGSIRGMKGVKVGSRRTFSFY